MDKVDYAVLGLSVLVLVDGLMTLPFWHLEGNPIVLAVGPWGMLSVKTAGVCGLLWLWFGSDGVSNLQVNKSLVWALTAVYALVVGSNALVIIA